MAISSFANLLITVRTQGLRVAQTQLLNTTRAARGLETQAVRLKGVMSAIGTGTLAIGAVRYAGAMNNLLAKQQQYERTLKAVIKTEEDQAWITTILQAESNRLGIRLQDARDSLLRFVAASEGSGLGLEQMVYAWRNMSEGMAILGKNSHETRGALKSLEQMMSKGKVMAEELTGQLGEWLPGALLKAARAYGMGKDELFKVMEAGELVPSEFVMLMADQLKVDIEGFGKRVNTYQAEVNRLGNAWDDFNRKILKSGVGDFMTRTVQMITSAFEEMRDQLASGEFDHMWNRAFVLPFQNITQDFAAGLAVMMGDNNTAWNSIADKAQYTTDAISFLFKTIPEGIRLFIASATINITAWLEETMATAIAYAQAIGAAIKNVGLEESESILLALEKEHERIESVRIQSLALQKAKSEELIQTILNEQQEAGVLRNMYTLLMEEGEASATARLEGAEKATLGVRTEKREVDNLTGAYNKAANAAARAHAAGVRAIARLRKGLLKPTEKLDEQLEEDLALIDKFGDETKEGAEWLTNRLIAQYDEENAAFADKEATKTNVQKKELAAREENEKESADKLAAANQTRINTMVSATMSALNTISSLAEKYLGDSGSFGKVLEGFMDGIKLYKALSGIASMGNQGGSSLWDIVSGLFSFGGESMGGGRGGSKKVLGTENVSGGGTGEAVTTVATSAASSAFTTFFKSLFSGFFDEGGTIPQGRIGIVGERGPEMVRGPAVVTSRKETFERLREQQAVKVPAPEVKVRVVNVIDPETIANYLSSEEGERIVLNHMRMNGFSV